MDRLAYNGRKPPAYLTRAINARGGFNPWGQPRYRLVWAPDVYAPSGGVWLDWLPGTSMADRDEAKTAPLRRSIEVRMVKRYGPLTGWILEKWVPAAAYGTAETWYSPAVVGGTMLWVPWANQYVPSQGRYPTFGEYEYASYHFPTDGDLSEALVVAAIGRMEQYLDQLPSSPYGRILRRVYLAKQAEEMADKYFERYAFDLMDDAQPAFNGQSFTGAGEKRKSYQSQVAERLGITSHVE